MQPILQPKKSTPLSLKLVIGGVCVVAVISFFFSVKYAGESKKEYPDLLFDPQLNAPETDAKGGFYTDAFDLKLVTNNFNCKIYFTLDGTEPSLKSAVYNKPIIIQNRTEESNNFSNIPTSPRWKPPVGNVFKGTVVRAIAVTDDNKKSKEFIRTYFVDKRGDKRYSFPVVAITINPDDMFGYKNGIYVLGKNYDDKRDYLKKEIPLDLPWWKYPSNYLKRGNNAERPIFFEFFDNNTPSGFASDAGIRINGNATRGYAQKSLRINFRNEYGLDALNYKLFPTSEVTSFSSFILRNSGNDWDKTMFRDAFMQSLMLDSKMDTQNNRPTIVFVNGEYWGIHALCERFDENYISKKYKISTDSIIILEMSGNVYYGKKYDGNDFKEMLAFIKANDLSVKENYEKVKNQMDIDNFIDFIITNIYYCNSDWPNNNVKFWRYKTNTNGVDSAKSRDGRWRWMLYDTDYGFGFTGADAYQMNLLNKAKTTGSVGIIFSGLLQNKLVETKFIYAFQLRLNTTYNTDKVIKTINKFETIFSPEMEENINRWRAMGSYSKWKDNVNDLKDFATKRPAIQVEQLNAFFKLSGANKITINK